MTPCRPQPQVVEVFVDEDEDELVVLGAAGLESAFDDELDSLEVMAFCGLATSVLVEPERLSVR